MIYGDKFVPASPRDAGTCDYWNREHLWSRSRGVFDTGKDNTDVHHLRPCDCNVNSARSNKYFGKCGTASTSSCTSGPAHPEAAVDTETDSVTFLPPVSRRGDVARSILYMDLRYDGDVDETNTYDLIVSDCPEDVPNGAGMGYLSQLLQWHIDDPPDVDEQQRNNDACTDWQGNRNPFIDFPELASAYHGGIRSLPTNGEGYDCLVPPPPPGSDSPTITPPPGTCSDDASNSCSSVDDCNCAIPFTRKLESNNNNNLRGVSFSSRKLQSSSSALIISGVMDGPLTGGFPKMVELYALQDVANLANYGIGSANNGGGTDGQEFTLSGSVTAGSYLTISSEGSGFQSYFGELPTFITGAMNVNGDDAIELFFNGAVIDTYGVVTIDGTGQNWEYMDGWAYRTSVGGGGAFDINEWNVSGKDAVDGCTANDSCSSSFPFKTFTTGPPTTNQPSLAPTRQPTLAPSPCAW